MSIEVWSDVGGTFTDCLARGPAGEFRTGKVLSSGITKGRIAALTGPPAAVRAPAARPGRPAARAGRR